MRRMARLWPSSFALIGMVPFTRLYRDPRSEDVPEAYCNETSEQEIGGEDDAAKRSTKEGHESGGSFDRSARSLPCPAEVPQDVQAGHHQVSFVLATG